MKAQLVKLKELCKIQSGGTPRRGVEGFYGGNIPWAKIGDIENAQNGYLSNTVETITIAGLRSINNKIFPKNTVFLAMYGSVGKTSIAGLEMATNQAILGLQPNSPDILDFKYLRYWLDCSKNNLISKARGVALQNISATIIKEFEIPLLPLEDQKRIVKMLDHADALRLKRKQAISLLDDYLKSVFLEMFGDPKINPKRFPLIELQELYIDKKNGTKCGPFGSALKKEEFVPDGIPVWNMDNISTSGRMIMPFRMWITPEKYHSLEAYSVLDGDIVISRAGTVGKMCVAKMSDCKSIISTNLIRVRLGNKLLPLYFVSLMNYCKGRIGRLKTGADGAFTHMNTGVLDTLTFPYPPFETQRQFAAIVESTESLKQKMLAQLVQLEAQFQALMQKAFK